MALWTDREAGWIIRWMRDEAGYVTLLLQNELLENDLIREKLLSVAKDHANSKGAIGDMPFVLDDPAIVDVLNVITAKRQQMNLELGLHITPSTNEIPHETILTVTVEVVINNSGTRGTGEVAVSCSAGSFAADKMQLVEGKATFEWTAPTMLEGKSKEYSIEVVYDSLVGHVPITVMGPTPK